MVRRVSRSPPLLFTLLLASSVTIAQETQPDCVEGEEAGSICDDPRMEHVIVTATRRELPLGRVPVSVTALSGDTLEDMGASTFEDYARSVPGLFFTDVGFGGEKYVIRGVTTDTYAEARATTAVYFDETPITDSGGPSGLTYSPDPVLVDVARVEVLRGPQGTLFGSGSMGGAIRIISNEPDLNHFESFAEATFSNVDHGGTGYDVRAMLNTPLADNRAAIRAVAWYRDLSGWIDNTELGQNNVNNNETTGMRLAGTWFNQDRLTINGKIVYQDHKSDGSAIDQGNPPYTQQVQVKEPNEDEWSLANLNVEYEFDWANFISTSSWIDRTVDSVTDVTAFFALGPDLKVAAVNRNDINDFVQEFRLFSTAEDRFSWLVGLFYQDQDFDFNQDFPAPGFDEATGGLAALYGAPDNLYVGRSTYTLKQWAIFADLTWSFSEKLEGTVGGRWFNFDHGLLYEADGFFNGGYSQTSTSSDENGFTPKMGLSYFHSNDLTLYGTISSGYRPGGSNETGAETFPECQEELQEIGLSEFPRSYESDSLWSYEAGVKSNWSEKRVFMNAAIFYIDWEDIQTYWFLECGGGFFVNAGQASSQGIEIELTAFPIPDIELTLNGSYTDAKLTEDVPNLGGMKGDELPGVPKYTFGGSLTWFFQSFERVSSFLRADYQYVGESYNAIGADYRLQNPSYALTNLRLNFQYNHWETSLFINNLFNKRAIVTVHDGFTGQYVITAQPQTIGVKAIYTF